MKQNAVFIEHVKNKNGKEYFIIRTPQGQVLNVSESAKDMSVFLCELFTDVESKNIKENECKK